MVEAPGPEERDAILDLIVEQQADPTRRVAAVGLERDGIAAELDGFEPPWAQTVRVTRDGDALTGACAVEWDLELGRAWLIGPWVRGDTSTEHWLTAARALVDAMVTQAPPGITQFEMTGETVADGLAALASALGWRAGEANHLLIADAEVVAGWTDSVDPSVSIRPAAPADVAGIAPMHDEEFPGTYASADRLVDDSLTGDRTTLVAVDAGGQIVGYASGEVHDDGEAYIDYLVVAPEVRRSGAGVALIRALATPLVDASSLGQVALTVQDHRHPARALYARMGFRPEGAFVGYRSWT